MDAKIWTDPEGHFCFTPLAINQQEIYVGCKLVRSFIFPAYCGADQDPDFLTCTSLLMLSKVLIYASPQRHCLRLNHSLDLPEVQALYKCYLSAYLWSLDIIILELVVQTWRAYVLKMFRCSFITRGASDGPQICSAAAQRPQTHRGVIMKIFKEQRAPQQMVTSSPHRVKGITPANFYWVSCVCAYWSMYLLMYHVLSICICSVYSIGTQI